MTIKALKRLIDSRRIKARAPHADLWMEVAQALKMERKLFPASVKLHLDRKSFIDRFEADLEWAFVSNQPADNAAGKRVDWLREQPVYSTYRDINKWIDQRLFRIEEHLLPRITHTFFRWLCPRPSLMARNKLQDRSFYIIQGLAPMAQLAVWVSAGMVHVMVPRLRYTPGF